MKQIWRDVLGQPQANMAAAFVLLIGLFLTGSIGSWLHARAEREGVLSFERQAEKVELELQSRFARVLGIFMGVRAYHASGQGHFNRDAFRIYMAARRVQSDVKGLRGVGFIQRVERDDLARFLDAERADAAPGFQVRTSGHAADLYVIKYIEPLSRNELAWGYDVGSEAVRREAAERAVHSGQGQLSRRITLVQDGAKRPGYLFLLPIYHWATKIDTPQDRQRNLSGLVYSPIVVDEFLNGLTDVADGLVSVELFDDEAAHANSLVFSSQSAGDQSAALTMTRPISLGGRTLAIRLRATPLFDARFVGLQSPAVWGIGSVLSGLLAWAVWLLMSGRQRAVRFAERATVDLSEAKSLAESALRDANALLDTMHKFNLVSVADPRGRIIEVNDAFCRVSGYSRDELLGQDHRIVNSGRHDSAFWRDMWASIRGGKSWLGDVCNRSKDGELYWVKSIMVPLFGSDGQVNRYLSIRTDITETKRQEQALSDMTERFQLAIDGGNDGLWDWFNVNDHKMWWSPQLYRMLGYAPDEMPVTIDTLEQLIDPDQSKQVMDSLAAALADLKPLDVSFRIRLKQGAYRWVRLRAKVFFDDAGFSARISGSLQDVHERFLAEEVVQKHSEQLSAIFSLSPDGFVSFGTNGQVNYASAAYGAVTGIAVESVLCLDEAEFLAQLLAQCVNPPPLRTLDDLRGSVDHKDPLSWASRHALVLELKVPSGRMLALSLYRAQGDAVSRLLLVRDVTHEAEVDRMKSRFLSMAAHELRTPMASIYGFVELLLHRDMKVERQKDLLARVYRQCEVMIDIINELLDIARMEHHRGTDFDCLPCHLQNVVLKAVNDYKPPVGRAMPHVAPVDAPLSVRADTQKLSQAVINVVSNAYKYSPQGGSVQISFPTRVDAEGMNWCGVSIEDEGIGMTPEQLAHMGERFYRADKSGNIPGTGLGVCIVKDIMEIMGGTLEVRSESGKGTVVVLWMPCEDEVAPLALAEY